MCQSVYDMIYGKPDGQISDKNPAYELSMSVYMKCFPWTARLAKVAFGWAILAHACAFYRTRYAMPAGLWKNYFYSTYTQSLIKT